MFTILKKNLLYQRATKLILIKSNESKNNG